MSSTRNESKILHEVKFILPEYNPDGILQEEVHTELESELVRVFGGFVVTASESIKMDKVANELVHDDVLIYEVVLEDTALHLTRIKNMAVQFAKQLKQKFVYFKQPNGEVYFLDVE